MSLLNKANDGFASVLIAIYRTLSVYGPQTEDDLVAIVAPPNLLKDGKADMVNKTLNRWKLLGFFETDANSKLRLSTLIPPYSPSNDDALRSAILELVLRERNNTRILPADDDEEDGGESFSDASDLTRAASWMLAQDPYTFPNSLDDAERLQSEQRFKSAFVNITRWSSFREWTIFLGLANTTAGRIVPNPVVAVRSTLFGIMGNRAEMPINAILDDLASTLPVLDGGRYRSEVQAQTGKPWREAAAHEISPSLSAALMTLEASKDIRLAYKADAPQRMLLGTRGVPLREVSFIVDLRSKA
jgi:hypothetical protein